MAFSDAQRAARSRAVKKACGKKAVNIFLTEKVREDLAKLTNLLECDRSEAITKAISNMLLSHVTESHKNVTKSQPIDLQQFSKEVQTYVDEMTPDKGHGIRIYISDVHKHFNMPLDTFKSMLLDCHKDRHINLCNANDGGQRSSEKGELSETVNHSVKGVIYHFIRQSDKADVTQSHKSIDDMMKSNSGYGSAVKIAKELNDHGLLTERGKKWSRSNVTEYKKKHNL